MHDFKIFQEKHEMKQKKNKLYSPFLHKSLKISLEVEAKGCNYVSFIYITYRFISTSNESLAYSFGT